MEAAFRKVRDRLTQEPSRLLNSLSRLSEPIGRANSQMDLQLNGMFTPDPPYRSSDMDHLEIHSQIDQGEPAPSGLSGSSHIQESSHGQIDEDLDQANGFLQDQLLRNSPTTPLNSPSRNITTPLFSNPSARLVDQANFWSNEIEQYLEGRDISLSVVEGYLTEVRGLTKQFESLNPDRVKVEEQVDLANKYQSIRKLQLRLINTIGKLKDRHHARQSLKVTMPCFLGRASEWSLFKREFHSWSQHLTETERRVSFLKAIEATEIKNIKCSNLQRNVTGVG